MSRAPVSRQTPELPPCDGCGEFDTGAYGFGPPGWPRIQHFCGLCTPSRTGAIGLRAGPVSRRAETGDLFGRAG